ncbi:uncharacterized protein LOC131008535 isoform X2 [Salvia miltiorrhiza]|uniref:uncharacterized protein LOC131008535 isoform X2 n=1 Tax=Salvia miltiorrhiza TaxID=226208 RepID=UPI0025ABAA0B|nr:uncharacterized protein LOC131008535 isoform X2 [Salvia miltiorrhiza]
MEYGNQPVSTALEKGKDEQYLNKPNGTDVGGWTHGTCSFEDEVMSLPPISLGYDQFSGRDIQDDCYFYTPDLNCIENPKVRKNWTDVSESCTEYEMLPPELSMRGDGVDCLMSPAITSMDYGNLEIPTNLTPPGCETGTAYPIKNHGAEAQSSRISRFQMSGQFSSSRCSTSLLPLVNNLGARGNKNDINIGHLSSSSSQKIDQDFLTLGIGGGRYFRPNSNFSTREISNKLEEVSSQCNNPITGPRPKNIPSQLAGGDATILAHAGGVSRPKRNFSARKHSSKVQEVPSRFNNSSIGHCPKNALSLSQLSGGNARFQANAGGLSISSSNFSKGIPSELEGFTFPGGPATVRINAGGLSGPACSRMLEGGLIGETGFRLDSDPFPGLHTLQTNTPTNAPSKCYTSVAEPSSMPLSSRSTLLSQPKCGSQPQIMSTYFASQPISWQQDCSRKSSMNVSSESSRNYHSHRDKLSSTSHVQPGHLSSSVEGTSTGVAKVGSFPSSVQPAGQFHAFHNISPIAARGNYISPEKLRLQLLKNSSYQSTAAGCFPKRLGLQPNDFATARRARGPYQHGISVQSSAVLPRVDNSNGSSSCKTKYYTSGCSYYFSSTFEKEGNCKSQCTLRTTEENHSTTCY